MNLQLIPVPFYLPQTPLQSRHYLGINDCLYPGLVAVREVAERPQRVRQDLEVRFNGDCFDEHRDRDLCVSETG